MQNLKILSVAAALLLSAPTFAIAKGGAAGGGGGGEHGGGGHSSGGGIHSRGSMSNASRTMTADPGVPPITGAGMGASGLAGSNAGGLGSPSTPMPMPSGIAAPSETAPSTTMGPAAFSSSGPTEPCAAAMARGANPSGDQSGCGPLGSDPLGTIAAPPSIMTPPSTTGAR